MFSEKENIEYRMSNIEVKIKARSARLPYRSHAPAWECSDGRSSVIRHCVAIATGFLEVGSRPDSRGTFLCLSKEKYPKETTPHAAWILRSSGLSGQIRSKPPVLGAASGEKTVGKSKIVW
jgi:hypothetical protein